MFINRLNQLYKPGRLLYFAHADDAAVRDFYAGKIPEPVSGYSKAYGTYDHPGLFYIKSLGKAVIGIEYRADDENVDYPEGLDSTMLDGAFFYSVEIDDDINVTLDSIKEIFKKIGEDDDAHRNYSDLAFEKDPEVISIFHSGNKLRILCEMKVTDDRATAVINDDAASISKDFLYKKAFIDSITGHYNWNHLLPFLEMPMDYGISDYAFVHFDIKEFKVINEVYGHIAANRVLCNVVKAMNEADFVYTSARCHNDNFAMMIKDMPEDVMRKRLTEFFEKLSHIEDDPNYRVYYRCGVVPMQTAMLSCNRVADWGKMAQALGTDPNKTEINFYRDEMQYDNQWGNYLKAYLDTAISNKEITVYMRSQKDAKTGETIGAATMIRWNFKHKTFLYPGKFIPYLERDGSIGKIEDMVLNEVCTYLAGSKAELPVTVGLSATRLTGKELVRHLTETVDQHKVSRGLICFELTASMPVSDNEQIALVLNELKAAGFTIADSGNNNPGCYYGEPVAIEDYRS